MVLALKVGVLFAALASASPVRRQAPSVRYLFAFGDSYTSSSFNINGVQPSTANPLGNPTIGQGTTSKGPNYIAYLTTTYNHTLTYTFDFAQSGATVSQTTTPNSPIAFEDQVGTLFKPKYSAKPAGIAPWTSANAIFSIFIGINDIGINYRKANRDTLITTTMQYYWKTVQTLYDTGARKFIFINVPPLSRSPNIMGSDPTGASIYADWVTEYNRQLAVNIQSFKSSHSGVQVAAYNFNGFFTKALDSPASLGFQDATCIGNGGTMCIWADGYHPGYTLDNFWAKDMLPTLASVGW